MDGETIDRHPGERPQPGSPPGWYADPIRESSLRWWDGEHWAAELEPVADSAEVARERARQGASGSAQRAPLPPIMSPDGLWRWEGTQWAPASPAPTVPRKKRHVLLWIFVALNVLFALWIDADINATVSDACVGVPPAEYEACREVNEYGAGLGSLPLIAALAAVDVLLMAGYGLYHISDPHLPQ